MSLTKQLKVSVFIVTCLACSCAPSRFVKPLEKHQHAINTSLGGPLIKYGNSTIPIPFITATYGYGIDSTLTGFAGINVTSALFGNVQTEIGVLKQVVKQKNYFPALTITPEVNFIYHNSSPLKIYPQVDINAYWEYGKHKNFFYVGIDNWFELSKNKAFDIKQSNHWFLSPMIGHTFIWKQWSLNIESKIIAPNISNKNIVVDYVTPFDNHGALGVYIGCTRKF